MRRLVAALLLPLFCSSCLAHHLRRPAADLVQQWEMIAESCRTDGYGEGLCVDEVFEAHGRNLRCVQSIANGEECDDG